MKKISILFLAVFSLFFVAFAIPQAYSAPITGDVNLNVEVYKGEGEAGKVTGHGLSQYAYGSRVSISLEGLKLTQNKEFGFYLYKGQLIEDEEAEFLVTDSSKITVVLKESTEVVAAFVDTNGALLDLKYGEGTFTPIAPTSVSNRPGFEFSGFGTVSSISVDTLFVAQYTRTNTTDISVTVTGGALVTGVTYNDVVTLEPTDAVNFKYWADADGQFVSSKPDYTFTALEDVEFVAVTEGVAPTAPSVYLSNVSGIRAGYQSFLGYVEYDETYELLEYGVLVSDEAKVLELGDADVEKKKPSTVLSPINEFLRSFVEGTYSSFRAYAIFKQGTEQVVVYSDNNFYIQEGVSSSNITETFEGLTISSSSYTNGNFTGINAQVWNYTASRGDQTLYGKALTTETGVLSTTFTNGLTFLSFDYVRAFTGTKARSFDIYINGIKFETINVDPNSNTVTTFTSGELAFTGNVLLEIRGFGTQKKIDNIVWRGSNIDPIDSKLYKIEYINNDNVSYVSNIANVVTDEPITPTKEGYSFVGWFDESNELFDFNTPITRHTTLTAVYEINEYTLTFNTDGGTAVEPIIGNFATSVSAPDAPTKEGYTFAGWTPELPETMPAGNQTYTATWTPNDYTITFDVDGGSVVAQLTQAYGSELVMPENPTKSGYNFAGWFTDQARTIPFEAKTMPLGNTTLYAKWADASLTSTVTFETNGGSDILPVVVNNGEAVLEPEDPTQEGYTFVGWYSDSGLSIIYDFDNVITTDITLYAKWNAELIIIKSSDFGETSGSPNYDGPLRTIEIENGVNDPNPSGKSSWKTSGENFNNAGWAFVRIGGKTAGTKAGAEKQLQTNFSFTSNVRKIEIDIVGLDSASGVEVMWLQTSSNGTDWTDVTSINISLGINTFDNLNIDKNHFIRFVIVRGSTGSNAGTDVKTINFFGFPE
ncbi:Internalin-A precursor [Acholeplasma oculi]|nr:InlB B-repeat-containing protein [Acholeplasma oculi]SKC39461.1 Listeria/Bacterioides repeat-containing protein [Acholeplasma oculi]SUT91790.1 Internalin-A precursor [Acholeplasma oculi]